MRRWLTSIVLATVLVAGVAFAVAGCGSQKRTIPTKQAQSFLQQLDNISSQFDNAACTGAGAKVAALEAQVRRLPSSVDSQVKRNLEEGVARLGTLVSSQCQRPTPTNTTPTNTVPTTTVPTTTVPTNTAPTTTTPTTPNTTPTTPNTTPTTPGTTPGGGGGGVTVPSTIGGTG
jgi:TolA-binding protein